MRKGNRLGPGKPVGGAGGRAWLESLQTAKPTSSVNAAQFPRSLCIVQGLLTLSHQGLEDLPQLPPSSPPGTRFSPCDGLEKCKPAGPPQTLSSSSGF